MIPVGFVATSSAEGTRVAVNDGDLIYTKRADGDWDCNQSDPTAGGSPGPRGSAVIQWWIDNRPEKCEVTLP
jgi:hypothetical protein